VSVRTVGIANQKQTFLERLYVARSERFSKRFSNVEGRGEVGFREHTQRNLHLPYRLTVLTRVANNGVCYTPGDPTFHQ